MSIWWTTLCCEIRQWASGVGMLHDNRYCYRSHESLWPSAPLLCTHARLTLTKIFLHGALLCDLATTRLSPPQTVQPSLC